MKSKNLTIFIITLSSILIVFLIFILVYLLNNNSRFYFNFGDTVSDKLVLDETYDTIFDEIKIDSKTSNIEIKNSIDEKIKLVIYGEEEKLEVNKDNNKLNIKTSEKNCIGFCFNRKIFKIELYLPITYDKKLIIDNNYGDVSVSEFENMEISAKLSAGDINIEKIKSGKIVNNYGDIKINGYSKKLDITEDCGDVYVSAVDDIKVTNKFGDIKINKVNNSLNIKDDCGDIKIDELDIKKNSSIHNSLGDITLGSTNDIYIDAKTNLGDTKVNTSNKKSDITLTINNSCGDIEVHN